MVRRINGFHSRVMFYNPEAEESRLDRNTLSHVQDGIRRISGVVDGSRSLRVWKHGLGVLDSIGRDFNNADVRRHAADRRLRLESNFRAMFGKEEVFQGVFQE